MQHNQAQSTVDSLLQAHIAATEQVRVLCRSAGRYWIHQQSCEALASTYKQALQKLTSMLTLPLISYHLNAHQLQLRVQPALHMLLAAIHQGMHFLETCRPPPANLPKSSSLAASSTSSAAPANLPKSSFLATSSTSSVPGEDFFLSTSEYTVADDMKSWLHRALLKGCATDAIDVHLHDFLVAFSTVCAAIEDLNAQYMARGRLTDQAPSPDLFWKEEREPHVLLISGHKLDTAKNTDDIVLNSLLESVMNLRAYDDGAGTKSREQVASTVTMAADADAAQVAAFVKGKIRCARQALHEKIDPGFLDQPLLDIKRLEVDSRPMFSAHTTSVHKVEWLGRRFALKVYYKKDDDIMFNHMGESTEDIYTEGSTEQKIQARLNHPNVVHAVALYKTQEEYGILMELMDGNLKSFLQKHRFSLRLQEKVSIMLQIAKGMAYVHGRGVIHRDLKPSNVLISSSMGTQAFRVHQLSNIEVKVADFGESNIISRSLDSSSFTTKRIGTTVYRAPEVLNDSTDSSDYKRSADVYSFAMTCFELLAEKEPFNEIKLEKRKTLHASVIKGERPDLGSISDDVCPLYLKHCLNTWWAHDPKTRHSFTHICCILRHLYVCLAGCQSDTHPITQFPFLAWRFGRWRYAQDIAQQRLHELDIRRANEDWKRKGYFSDSTRVNEIPYELHVMKWAIKKAAELYNEPEEAMEPNSSTPGQKWESSSSTHEQYSPNQSRSHTGESSRSDQFVGRSSESSNMVSTRTPPPTNERSSSTRGTEAGTSLGQKLKEFCCFTPARSIMPSTHEAFHDDIPRRN